MKHILVFGAGKSATCLINYLSDQLSRYNWRLTVADSDLELAKSKLKDTANSVAVAVDVTSDEQRSKLIASCDIVVSLLPPSLHILVAGDCLRLKKNLLTASYADPAILALKSEVENSGLLFLCEMGLDPGIDHMSAMEIFESIWSKGGKITSFRSHCGGLVAPESDNNPWRYKISWNPRNIVMAGKNGARYRQNGRIVEMGYEQLFADPGMVDIPSLGKLAYYPNRDSMSYIDLYGLSDCDTFVRTTLRYPEFMYGWNNLIELNFTDEHQRYETDGMTLLQFFQEHLQQNNFSSWMERQVTSKMERTRDLLDRLQELMKVEEQVRDENSGEPLDIMMIDDKGDLNEVNIDQVKLKAAETVAGQMNEANLAMKQLMFLGLADDETRIDNGNCSAADVLQFILERKLSLSPDDRDMIVMLHEIEYELEGKKYLKTSSLVVKGRNSLETAMAQTVGLPLGIAVKLVLQGQIALRGVQVPVVPEIYTPVLHELHQYGIRFSEQDYLLEDTNG